MFSDFSPAAASLGRIHKGVLCAGCGACAGLSPRRASSATVALNLSEKRRLVVICASSLKGLVHLSTLSSLAEPLHFQGGIGVIITSPWQV